MKFLLSLGGGLVLSVLVLSVFGSGSASASDCGPHEDFVDDCAAGDDSYDTTTGVFGIDTTGNCRRNANFVLTGPVDKITRSGPLDDSVQFPGTRPVDAHNDVIDTEIVSMSLTGGGITMRVGTGTPGIDAGVSQTLGAIAEQPANPRVADSFFDVFVELDDGGTLGGPFYNQSPLRIEAEIRQIPPKTTYLHLQGLCLDLFDAPVGGNDTGFNLVEAKHITDIGVGGTVELLSGGDGTDAFDAEDGGFSFALYAALAGGFAAAAVALAAGGWHAKRRWMR